MEMARSVRKFASIQLLQPAVIYNDRLSIFFIVLANSSNFKGHVLCFLCRGKMLAI